MPRVSVSVGVFVIKSPCSGIHLAPYDRFYAFFFAGFIEVDHTKHGPVIGDRAGLHAKLFDQ